MKFPKLFGRKSKELESVEEYDDFDDGDEDAGDLDAASSREPDEGGAPIADEDELARRNGDDDDDFDDDDEDDDERVELEPPALNRRLSPLAVIGTIVTAITVVGAFGWWIIETDSMVRPDKPAPPPNPRHVVMDIAPRPPDRPKNSPARLAENLSAAETLNAIAAMSEGPDSGGVVKPVQLAAFRDLPEASAHPLSKAPDVALVEKTQIGPLPRIGGDGRKPWQVYSRPFHAKEGTPRLAIIFAGLGMSHDATQAAITYLPADITLSLDPYGTELENWAIAARQAGHEILLGLPMEPAEFPTLDPGPFALVTPISPADNLQRLNFLLGRFSGYSGILTLMGSRFTQHEEHMRPILEVLGRRGLMYIDSQNTMDTLGPRIAREFALPSAVVDIELDADPSQAAIDRQLAEFERIAREDGAALAIARPYPVSIERVSVWAKTLTSRRMALAPASAIIGKQFAP